MRRSARSSSRLSIQIRYLGVAAAAVFSIVAAASALDRAGGEDDPVIAAMVPDALAVRSLDTSLTPQLAQARPRDAERMARLLIERAPIDSTGPAMLGAARMAMGQQPKALEAFTVSAKMGWRELSTQLFWIGQALQLGDVPNAAMRFDVILRQHADLLTYSPLIEPWETTPDLRAALFEKMLRHPLWLGAYAREGWRTKGQVLQARGQILVDLGRAGVTLGCSDVKSMTAALANSGNAALGRDVWTLHCPLAGKQLVGDPGFATLSDAANADSPYAWTWRGNGDVTYELRKGDRNNAGGLLIHNAAPVAMPILQQLLVLKPGTYRATYRLTGGAGNQGTSPLQLAISCDRDNRQPLDGQRPLGNGRWQVDFAVDGQCPAQWLNVILHPTLEATQFGELAIVEARPGAK